MQGIWNSIARRGSHSSTTVPDLSLQEVFNSTPPPLPIAGHGSSSPTLLDAGEDEAHLDISRFSRGDRPNIPRSASESSVLNSIRSTTHPNLSMFRPKNKQNSATPTTPSKKSGVKIRSLGRASGNSSRQSTSTPTSAIGDESWATPSGDFAIDEKDVVSERKSEDFGSARRRRLRLVNAAGFGTEHSEPVPPLPASISKSSSLPINLSKLSRSPVFEKASAAPSTNSSSPMKENVPHSTPNGTLYDLKRGILKDTTTPRTGHSVRWFSPDTLKIISPNSCGSEPDTPVSPDMANMLRGAELESMLADISLPLGSQSPEESHTHGGSSFLRRLRESSPASPLKQRTSPHKSVKQSNSSSSIYHYDGVLDDDLEKELAGSSVIGGAWRTARSMEDLSLTSKGPVPNLPTSPRSRISTRSPSKRVPLTTTPEGFTSSPGPTTTVQLASPVRAGTPPPSHAIPPMFTVISPSKASTVGSYTSHISKESISFPFTDHESDRASEGTIRTAVDESFEDVGEGDDQEDGETTQFHSFFMDSPQKGDGLRTSYPPSLGASVSSNNTALVELYSHASQSDATIHTTPQQKSPFSVHADATFFATPDADIHRSQSTTSAAKMSDATFFATPTWVAHPQSSDRATCMTRPNDQLASPSPFIIDGEASFAQKVVDRGLSPGTYLTLGSLGTPLSITAGPNSPEVLTPESIRSLQNDLLSTHDDVVSSLQKKFEYQTEIAHQLEADLSFREAMVLDLRKQLQVAQSEKNEALRNERLKVDDMGRKLAESVEMQRQLTLDVATVHVALEEERALVREMNQRMGSVRDLEVRLEMAQQDVGEQVAVAEDAERRVEDAAGELKDLRQDLQKKDSEKKDLEIKIVRKDGMLAELQTQIEELQTNSSSAILRSSSLLSPTPAMDNLSFDAQNLIIALAQTRRDISLASLTHASLQQNSAKADEKLAMLQSEVEAQWSHNEEADDEIKRLKNREVQLVDELDRKDVELTDLERSLDEVCEYRDKLIEEVKQRADSFENLEKRNAALDEALQQQQQFSEDDTATWNHKHEFYKTQVAQLDREITTHRNTVDSLHDEVEAKDRMIRHLTRDVKQRDDKILELEAELENKQGEISIAYEHRAHADQIATERGSRDEAAQSEIARLNQVIVQLKAESADKEVRITHLVKVREQLREDKEGLNIAVDSKQLELEMLKRKFGVRGIGGTTPAKPRASTAQREPPASASRATPTAGKDLETPLHRRSSLSSIRNPPMTDAALPAESRRATTAFGHSVGTSSNRLSFGPSSKAVEEKPTDRKQVTISALARSTPVTVEGKRRSSMVDASPSLGRSLSSSTSLGSRRSSMAHPISIPKTPGSSLKARASDMEGRRLERSFLKEVDEKENEDPSIESERVPMAA